jgi:UDP-glucose 6-dehydrogenase
MARVAVVGTGYVGLTTGACFAHLGHHVVCADIVPEKVERLSRGDVPILEAGLDEMVRAGLDGGRLSFVLGAANAVEDAEFVYLCVPTPQSADGSADLSFIRQAAAEIGPALAAESVVVNKSTVPVGSTRVVEQALGRDDIAVVSNPEFLREGSAVHDFLNPDRIVIGCEDPAAAGRVASLFERIQAPVIVTDPASAETIKYASNAFLATKVSFVNAIANVCEVVGADVREVVLGMGYDKRIGFEFLKPGPGYGGSCLAGRESVLVRRAEDVRLLSMVDLFAEVDRLGPDGWEVLTWWPGDPTPEFARVSTFTSRPWQGDALLVRTKMGRRVVCTPDHPFVVGDGATPDAAQIRLARDLSRDDWLPIALGAPLAVADPPSRILAAWFGDFLRLGEDCPTKRLPDLAWSLVDEDKQALLRGLWDGGGSWSCLAGGPSVAFEYGTVSRELADGMARMLGELGIVCRTKVGRTTKSTVETYWLVISGAGQLEEALFLFPEAERELIRASIGRQAQRIAPTGYRRLGKNAAWVRVVEVDAVPGPDRVYSLEVPSTGTIVTTAGLVTHNCFPKDTSALVRIAEDAGYDFGLLRGVIGVNDEQFDRVTAKVERMVGGSLREVLLAVWGLTFKARTDDLRSSPALEVVRRLIDRGARVRAYDPAVREAPAGYGIELVADPYAACEGAAAVVVLTEWDEFRSVDFAKVADALEHPRVVDARNLLDPVALRRRGFTYEGVGR